MTFQVCSRGACFLAAEGGTHEAFGAWYEGPLEGLGDELTVPQWRRMRTKAIEALSPAEKAARDKRLADRLRASLDANLPRIAAPANCSTSAPGADPQEAA